MKEGGLTMPMPDGITCRKCQGAGVLPQKCVECKQPERFGRDSCACQIYELGPDVPCLECHGTGRLYTRDDLDAAAKAERERTIFALAKAPYVPCPPGACPSDVKCPDDNLVCWLKYLEREAPDAPHAD